MDLSDKVALGVVALTHITITAQSVIHLFQWIYLGNADSSISAIGFSFIDLIYSPFAYLSYREFFCAYKRKNRNREMARFDKRHIIDDEYVCNSLAIIKHLLDTHSGNRLSIITITYGRDATHYIDHYIYIDWSTLWIYSYSKYLNNFTFAVKCNYEDEERNSRALIISSHRNDHANNPSYTNFADDAWDPLLWTSDKTSNLDEYYVDYSKAQVYSMDNSGNVEVSNLCETRFLENIRRNVTHRYEQNQIPQIDNTIILNRLLTPLLPEEETGEEAKEKDVIDYSLSGILDRLD